MYCSAWFKVYTGDLGDYELDFILKEIGIEPGVRDGCLYYCLNKCDTLDEKFIYSTFLHITLGYLINKKELLIDLKNKFNLAYEVDVKFSDMEAELERNTSFALNDEVKSFIIDTEAFYYINKEYIEL